MGIMVYCILLIMGSCRSYIINRSSGAGKASGWIALGRGASGFRASEFSGCRVSPKT